MDPRRIIRDAAEKEEYTVCDHCLEEMDQDGISIEQVEHVMQKGKVKKREPTKKRYTLKKEDKMICAEFGDDNCIVIITAGRER